MDSQFHNGKRTRRGVSLIEVLVVLVILVVGILTIIRLFPSGFFSIQSTGNAGSADALATAALGTASQNAQNFPEAILVNNLGTDNLLAAIMNASAYSNYDPDDPNTLDNARVVLNETISVPSVSNGQSVYVVNYGPVVMPADPALTAAAFPNYFTVNSTDWAALSGSSAPAAVSGGVPPPVTIPQATLVPGQERFMVDLVNQKIAVPYAPYTLTNSATPPPTYTSFDQRIVVVITGSDNIPYTQLLDVPAGTTQDSANPYAPKDGNNLYGYLPDTATGYQGGWFDPTKANSATAETPATYDYPDTNYAVPHHLLPAGVTWKSVSLFRPYNGITTPTPFGNDPYQFRFVTTNFGTANPGSIAFSPKAGIGSGAQARKAKISYIVSSWKILREDHDIPALTGTGSTFVVRTTVPNLKLAGSANPDNSINPGIAGSNYSLVIMDLDSGKIIAPGGVADPTNPDKPVNNEDLNGTLSNPSLVNISYSTGRLTFGSNAFSDNSAQGPTPALGSGTAPAHRIRIFYTADLDWTVAVQKPAAYFREFVTTPSAGAANGTTALAADQFSYDSADAFVYFARCNSGKTVEIDGTYTLGATSQSFSDTIAVDPILYALGDSALRVNLSDGTKFEHPVPAGATVTFSAVRGLSARSVVAWKERNRYKVHSVDTLLSRTP